MNSELKKDKVIFDVLVSNLKKFHEFFPEEVAEHSVLDCLDCRERYSVLAYGAYLTEKYIDRLAKAGHVKSVGDFEFGSWKVATEEDGSIRVEKSGEYCLEMQVDREYDDDPSLLKWLIGIQDGQCTCEQACEEWIGEFLPFVERLLGKDKPGSAKSDAVALVYKCRELLNDRLSKIGSSGLGRFDFYRWSVTFSDTAIVAELKDSHRLIFRNEVDELHPDKTIQDVEYEGPKPVLPIDYLAANFINDFARLLVLSDLK